jgi:hypothetical protein
MANPAPCQACLETPDAEFCITNRAGVPWPFEQAVVNVCVPCLINLGITMDTALQEAIASMEAEQQAGALEQIESDEGAVKVAPSRSKRGTRKKAPATVQVIDPEVPQEGEATDD